MPRWRVVAAGAGAATLLVASGCCSIFGWSTLYAERSPDGRGELRVEVRNCFADCAVRAVVQQGWTTVELASRNDCNLNFAHAAWRGTRVAVFVDDPICGQIREAYDLATRSPADFEAAKPWLNASIVGSYSVTPAELAAEGGDALAWATCSRDGNPRRSRNEFARRYLK